MLLEEGKTLKEIAMARGLALGTIMDHLEKIKAKDPRVALRYLLGELPVLRQKKIRQALTKGGMVVMATFFFLVLQILSIGALADENFEKFICLGTAMMLGVQFLLNTGSATGLTPVVGVTFPFVSYGGSSMLADFFLLAIVNSIRKRS